MMEAARDEADELDSLLDCVDEKENPTIYKRLEKSEKKLRSLSDDACDLKDRLFEFLP